MTSRLDRLFVLLESGSAGTTRKAAARQLGDVQQAHPADLQRLLARLTVYLRSPAWETRIAAGQAVEAILSNVPQWDPTPCENVKEEDTTPDLGYLTFETFDVDKVLERGAFLMASEGKEYDIDEEFGVGTDTRERLARQRQMLNARLRFNMLGNLDIDIQDVITNDDILPASSGNQISRQSSFTDPSSEVPRKPIAELMQQLKHNCVHPSGLSSREMNRAKRKARQAALVKQKPYDEDCVSNSSADATTSDSVACSDEPDKKKVKLEKLEDGFGNGYPLPDGTWPPELVAWPFESWFCWLTSQLFSESWEARHGAATAIRETLKLHGCGVGKERGITKLQMDMYHQRCLEDTCVRLVCVLGLDRFGDFVSDQVVAPVRESCAQALGVACGLLSLPRAVAVTKALARLAKHQHWEARHGGTLGYKYIAAAIDDVTVQATALKAALHALRDPAEDVGAAAAGALAGCASALCLLLPGRVLPAAAALWRLLRRHDELAAGASHAHMALLAALLAAASHRKLIGPVPLKKVLPRLWPYLYHSTSSVRKAALQTLRTLTHLSIQKYEENHDSKLNGDSIDATYLSNDNGLAIKTEPLKLELIILDDEVFDDESIEISDVSGEVDNEVEEQLRDQSNNDCVEEDATEWTPYLLQIALKHVFQRVLVEHVKEIQDIAEMVWEDLIRASSLSTLLIASCPVISTWLCLTMQPTRVPFDSAMLLFAQTLKEQHQNRLSSQGDNNPHVILAPVYLQQKWYIGGSESIPNSIRESNTVRARCRAASMLGLLSCYIVKPAPGMKYTPGIEDPVGCFVRVLSVYLSSCSALQRLVAALVVGNWARRCPPEPPPTDLVQGLHYALTVSVVYDEVASTCNRILQEANDFVAMMQHYKLSILDEEYTNIINLDQVVNFTINQGRAAKIIEGSKLKKNIMQTLEARRKSINSSAIQSLQEYNNYNISTLAALAGACANLSALPEKLNPVFKPLMESIKREPEETLQRISAADLAVLLAHCVDRDPCPNVKVLVNLRTFLCCDPDSTPRTVDPSSSGASSRDESGESSNDNSNHHVDFRSDKFAGILTLVQQQRQAERSCLRRSHSTISSSGFTGSFNCGVTTSPLPRGPGRPPISDAVVDDIIADDEGQKLLWTQRRGASFAFVNLVEYFAEDLPEKLPKLWEFIVLPFTYNENSDADYPSTVADELILNMQVLEIVSGSIAKKLLPKLLDTADCGALSALPALLRHPYTAVRHMAARCAAALAAIAPQQLMQMIVDQVVLMLEADWCSRRRQGAAECLACVVDKLQINIVPYIVLLVVPLLRRMSDQDTAVRLTSTHCFATLIQLMPLEGASEPPGLLPPTLSQRRDTDRLFLYQLFNPKLIPDYKLPMPINAELREYQQAGVNWLSFLNRYGLHGVLCDDMGLGKTLQSICIVAGDHYARRKEHLPELQSLVICPQTLTGHWVYEANKFLSEKYLTSLQYVGPPFEREKLRTKLKYYDLVVASYDIVRKDIEFFSTIKWNYCILDEGHVIKNGKTKASKAIKSLMAKHRLILSGTPIQNNVLELWSLFDFLMPGLLGTERQFAIKYSRPILAARDPRATNHHQEAGALAMEKLHRQVLPFLLRRMKEDVLTELPPKITQDYYCDLSPLQQKLYEDFSKVHIPSGMDVEIESQSHIFQALRYLQNVCNHPKLVLTSMHPQYNEITNELAANDTSLNDIQHSAKLSALMQLLQDCGIGCTPSESSAVVSQHRVLIFCQLRSMLDIVEQDLLKAKLPSVSYLRLDGRVPPSLRHHVVRRFNRDPSIDLLLLTTQVGGLGLNLTGADTVIFVEHDWNPMKDLQAMDRAHRIGQKKVVNIYRLITRATLEERIMGLQKFKLLTANTVISSENASLQTMGTDHLLDLFQSSDKVQCFAGTSKSSAISRLQQNEGGKMTMKTVLENLPDLWDDKQYEEEYDMVTFIQKLKK